MKSDEKKKKMVDDKYKKSLRCKKFTNFIRRLWRKSLKTIIW